jgi:hypothetical protein
VSGHYLVVEEHEGEIDWHVEHPPECPLVLDYDEIVEQAYEMHTCPIGQWIVGCGIEDLTEHVNGIENLPRGRSAIEFHTSYDHFNGEHEAYLYFVDRVPASE